jgi:glycerol kinase
MGRNEVFIVNSYIFLFNPSDSGRLLFGTVDSWLIWNLTGQVAHLTDVTNASRTMLMDIRTLEWDPFLLEFFGVPPSVLPEIRSSAELFGRLRLSRLVDCPIAGCLGDQQAALLGQHCLSAGQTKATYGTGCFLLTNTGTMPVISGSGLLTTVAFRLGPTQPAYYALEGSIGHAGAALGWLRSVGIEGENSTVTGTEAGLRALPKSANSDGAHGVHVVPAFGGLLAPRWRPDARATITGRTSSRVMYSKFVFVRPGSGFGINFGSGLGIESGIL